LHAVDVDSFVRHVWDHYTRWEVAVGNVMGVEKAVEDAIDKTEATQS
jgi:hypothetical protein